jgi:hypothetical protein
MFRRSLTRRRGTALVALACAALVALLVAPIADAPHGRAATLSARQIPEPKHPANLLEFLASLAPGARIAVASPQAGTAKEAEAGALSVVSPEAVVFTNGKETTVVPLTSIRYVSQHATSAEGVTTYLYLWGDQPGH